MKNKKLLLSVLSTAVVASMASSAFAAEAGIYIGGDVKHYYNISSFFEPTNSAKIVSEANSAKLKNVVFVDTTGKAATLDNILASGSAALTDDLEAVFGDSLHDAYVPVDKNGQEGTDPVVPEPSDSPSVDGLTQVVDGGKVTISGNAVNADSVEVTVFKASEKVATKSVDVADNKFSVDFADLVAGDYTYEVVASNADEDSEVKTGNFKVEAPSLVVESVSAITETGKDATLFTNDTTDNTVKVVATAKDAVGATVSGVTYSYASNNSAVATVAADGTVTAVGNGTATITIKTTNAVVEKTTTVEITVDTKAEVQSAEAINATTLKINFNTPLKSGAAEVASNYKLSKADLTSVNVTNAQFAPGSDKKSVLLTTTVAVDSDYILRVSNVQNANGITIVAKNFNFKTASAFDTTKPEVTGDITASDSKTLLVNLSEPVKETVIAKTPSAYTIYKSDDTVFGNPTAVAFNSATQLKITLGSGLTNGATYKLSIAADTLEDLAGNKNAVLTKKTFAGVSDTNVPSITAAAEDATSSGDFTLTFDRNTVVSAATANLFEVKTDGTLTWKEDVSTAVRAATVTTTAPFKTSAISTTSGLEAGKTYKVVVKGLKNSDGYPATGSGELTTQFTTINLALTSAALVNGKVRVTYDNEVYSTPGGIYDLYEKLADGTYVKSTTTLGSATRVGTDNKSVDLTPSAALTAGKNYKVVAKNEINKSQNPDSDIQGAEFTAAAITAGNMTAVTQDAEDKLTLTFDKDINTLLTSGATLDVELYKQGEATPIFVGGATGDGRFTYNASIGAQKFTAVPGDNKKLQVQFKAGYTLAAGNYIAKITAASIADAVTANTQATFAAVDKSAPKVSGVEIVDAHTVKVTFDEVVDVSHATFQLKSLTKSGGAGFVNATAVTTSDNKTYTIKVGSGDFIPTGLSANTKTAYSLTDIADIVNVKNATDYIVDTAGNKIDGSSAIDAAITAATVTDSAAPEAFKAVLDDVANNGTATGPLVVSFTEEVGIGGTGASLVTLTGLTGLTKGTVTQATNKVDLNVAFTGTLTEKDLSNSKVEFAASGSTDYLYGDEDANGTKGAGEETTGVMVVNVTDLVAPKISTAIWNLALAGTATDIDAGDQLQISFSENINPLTFDLTDLAIAGVKKMDGSSVTITPSTDFELTSVSGNVATLTVKTGFTSVSIIGGSGDKGTVANSAANDYKDLADQGSADQSGTAVTIN